MTEGEMLGLLHQRFGHVSVNGGVSLPRYVCAQHVRARAGFDTRTADFIAMDTWESGKFEMQGVEVKVTRSDWLRELKDPHKSAPFMAWTSRWWVATPSAGIARPEELPEGWGLLVARPYGGQVQLRAVVQAPRRIVPPIPPESLASLLRAVQKTAAHRCPCQRAEKQFDAPLGIASGGEYAEMPEDSNPF
jgi:hypothetical protein